MRTGTGVHTVPDIDIQGETFTKRIPVERQLWAEEKWPPLLFLCLKIEDFEVSIYYLKLHLFK